MIAEVQKHQKRAEELETLMSEPGTLADPERLRALSKEYDSVKEILNLADRIEKNTRVTEDIEKTLREREDTLVDAARQPQALLMEPGI